MRKGLHVLRHEIAVTVLRGSFLFAVFGIPLISTLVFLVVSRLNQDSPQTISSLISPATALAEKPEGFVDPGSLVRSIPVTLPAGRLKRFPDETQAADALAAGEIGAYYLISEEYLETGRVDYVTPDFNPLTAFGQTHIMDWVLHINLLDGDSSLASQVENPLILKSEVVGQTAGLRERDHPMTFFLPYAVTILTYLVLLMSTSYLFNSVTQEKENRVMEILMASLSPQQLMSGKIIGLGLVGLLQATLWIGTSYALLRFSGQAFDVPAAYQLPVSFLLWALVFFLLGYAVYASLLAAVGTLVPNLRESSQLTFFVLLPLMVPMLLVGLLIRVPDGGLAIGLSLFPFSAPVAMMARLAATRVPVWQLALSSVLLLGTALLVVRLAARMYRAQTLISGQPFHVKRLAEAFWWRR